MEKKPFAFQWHITDACDQRCKHCYIYSADPARKIDATSLDQARHVIDQCWEMCRKFNRQPYFSLTGGDPILHPEFWNILSLLQTHNVDVSIMGNPFHLNDSICEKLANHGCYRYQMSLDGLKDTHDWFRKPGSFDCTLEKLGCLKKAGIETTIMTTVSGVNIHEIPALIDVVAEHEVDIYAFARYCPDRATGDNGLSPQAYRKLLDTCWHKFQEHEAAGCKTVFNLKDHLWTLYQYEEGHFTLPSNAEPGLIYSGCNCGNCHLTILPNGDLYACRRFDSKVGNVYEDNIVDVWLKPMERYRNFQDFSKCSKCELLPYCRGCPAVAYGATGSFYGADPQCWKEIIE